MTTAGPRGLTQQTAQATAAPTDLRTGVVTAVTARGIDVDVAGGLVAGAAHLSGYSPAVGDPVALVQLRDSWLALGRPIGPGTTLDTATPGPAVGMQMLDGCVLSGSGAVMASSTGAAVTVPRYGVNFHHPTNHWVLLWGGVSWLGGVVNDWLRLTIRDASSAASVFSTDHIQAGSTSFFQFDTFGALLPPSLGGKGASYYLDLQRIAGTGTAQVSDAAVRRGFLLALDMGDASMIRTV